MTSLRNTFTFKTCKIGRFLCILSVKKWIPHAFRLWKWNMPGFLLLYNYSYILWSHLTLLVPRRNNPSFFCHLFFCFVFIGFLVYMCSLWMWNGHCLGSIWKSIWKLDDDIIFNVKLHCLWSPEEREGGRKRLEERERKRERGIIQFSM